MQEIEFHNWLMKNGTSKKMISDHISRLKRLERVLKKTDLNFEGLDIAYNIDRCGLVFTLFENTGKNPTTEKLGDIDLPIGKYSLSTFKYSLKKYTRFLQEKENKK